MASLGILESSFLNLFIFYPGVLLLLLLLLLLLFTLFEFFTPALDDSFSQEFVLQQVF